MIVRRMSSGQAHNVRVRVLVVEDHVALANRIGEGLRDAGFAVDVVYDGVAALESTTSTGYDVVVLDRDLPEVHGDRVCRLLVRDGSPSRILMLTAAADVEDRVDGLELGADDYLGKPFAFRELVARIRALGRRGPGSPAVVRRGDLAVDRARHRASRANRGCHHRHGRPGRAGDGMRRQPVIHRFRRRIECGRVSELSVGGRLLQLHALARRAELPRP